MKIEIYSLSEKGAEKNDWDDIYEILIDDKLVFKVWSGEPEDNNMGRNFVDVYKLKHILQTVWDNGFKCGAEKDKSLILTETQVDDADELPF